MSRTDRLAAWLYERPRVRRAWRVCCALWCGAAWAVLAAPTAAAAPYAPTGPNVGEGQPFMAWTGLHDSYGVPVSSYYISTVSAFTAAKDAVAAQPLGLSLFDPLSWVDALVNGGTAAVSNILATGLLAVECALLIFIAAAGIWLIKFALSAPWLSWLASLANPFANSINVMVDQLYVIPIALLVCCGVGGVIALTKGMGRGLGIILGGFLIILLIYLLLRQPIHDMLGPDGVLGIGQYLGFMVAEGAVHNGPMAPGGGGAQLDALISLLCDALLREPIQMINFNTVVDDIPACANAWSGAIMTGQVAAPAQAMASCGDPGALTYASGLGLRTAGWCLVVILVELVVMFALVYIGFHVIIIGFKSFFNVLVLLVAAPLAVAPGPTRRFGRRSAHKLIIDMVEMLITTAGLGVLAIILAEVTSGSVPGLTGMTSPLAKLFMMLLLAVAGAIAYHHMLVSLRHGRGFWGTLHHWHSALGRFGSDQQYIDSLSVTATGYSLSGWRRRRMEYPDDSGHPLYRAPKTSDLWPPNANAKGKHHHPDHQPKGGADRPGRAAHPAPGGGGGDGDLAAAAAKLEAAAAALAAAAGGGRASHATGGDGPSGRSSPSGGDGPSGRSGPGTRDSDGPSAAGRVGHAMGSVGRAVGTAAETAAAPEAEAAKLGGEAVAGRAGSGHASEGPGSGPSQEAPFTPEEVDWDWPSRQTPTPPDPDPDGHWQPPVNPPGGQQPRPGR